MEPHNQKLIVMQTLVKEILPVVFNSPRTSIWTDQGIREETEKWCHWCYELAGRIGPQENTEFTKMHPNTLNKYIRRVRECIENEDSLGMVELRDSLKPGEWAYLHYSLYTEHSKEAKRLCDLADELEAG